MKISLERNNNDDRKAIPYFAVVNLKTRTITNRGPQFRIPINLKQVKGQNTYVAEICGFEMQGNSPQSILNLVKKVAPSLVNFGQMPTYMLIARHVRKVYPVYTDGDEVVTITTPGGPLIRHVELSIIRDRAIQYLNKVRALGRPGEVEKLHVRGVHQESLALIRPLFYLKKRPQDSDEHEFWAPVFPSDEHKAIYAYAASAKREVEVENGAEAFKLRSVVAQALIQDNRLGQDFDLRADRLLPTYWQKVEPALERLPHQLTFNQVAFDLYRQGSILAALEHRQNEDRYSFYLGVDFEDLRQRAGKDLVRRKMISDPAEVTIKDSVI